MPVRPKRLYTVEEYLAFERKSLERQEYMDGRIFPVGRPDEAIDIDSLDDNPADEPETLDKPVI